MGEQKQPRDDDSCPEEEGLKSCLKKKVIIEKECRKTNLTLLTECG